jgi:hypothetical protein
MKDFSHGWCTLILNFVSGASVAIKAIMTLVVTSKGDPLSPMLFNIVADLLPTDHD